MGNEFLELNFKINNYHLNFPLPIIGIESSNNPFLYTKYSSCKFIVVSPCIGLTRTLSPLLCYFEDHQLNMYCVLQKG